MGGDPANIDLISLAVLDTVNQTSKGRIKLGQAVPDSFDLVATIEVCTDQAWQNQEWWSSPPPNGGNVPQHMHGRFFLESIGPGPEVVLVLDQPVQLLNNGNLPGAPAGCTWYEVKTTNINPDGNFIQPDQTVETLSPGVYRVQSRVDYVFPLPPNIPQMEYTAWYSGDLILRIT